MENEKIPPIQFRLTKKLRLFALFAALLFFHPRSPGSETLTLTTYYPAPYGAYAALLTTQQTLLARNGGKVGIGLNSPLYKLHVNGDAAVEKRLIPARLPADSLPGVEGAMYFNTTTDRLRIFSSPGGWQDIAPSSPAALVQMYQCPPPQHWPEGGEWGFYGCQGQITSLSNCYDIEYPNCGVQDCAPIGKMGLY